MITLGAGLMASGMTTAALAASIVPVVGWIAAAVMVAGMAIGLFSSPEEPEYRQEEVREQTNQLASRIDITNSSLEWVNRNLVEMRQELTYIMRESFYFSEKSEAERFSIDSSRGTN